MNGRQHLVSGISTVVLLGSACCLAQRENVVPVIREFSHQVSGVFVPNSPWMIGVCAGLYCAGLLLPDIDQPNSTLGRPFREMEHRTWTHTAYFCAFFMVWAVACRYLFQAAACLALGCFVHIFWDSFSKCGVAWFKPKSGYRHFGTKGAKLKKGWHLVLYKNDFQAWIVCAVVATAAACLLFFTLTSLSR